MENTVEKVNSMGLTEKQMDKMYPKKDTRAKVIKVEHLHWFKNGNLCAICKICKDEVEGD